MMAHSLGPKSEFTSSARNQFFAKVRRKSHHHTPRGFKDKDHLTNPPPQLKPVCVDLSRLALQGQQDPGRPKRAQELLTQLNAALEHQIHYDASVLDDKIADYVFFPLSHILRARDSYPIRVIESLIASLRLLIQHGWKARISKDLSQQLLILLTFVVGGVPGQDHAHPPKPEETVLEGYKALTALIKAAGVSAKDSPLTDDKIIPSFGHAVSVVTDAITGGSTPEIQLEALQTLLAVYTVVKQDQVLASFFPGAVSSLSRVLSPPASTKSQKRVLISSINVLRVVLTKVLGDLKTRNLLRSTDDEKQEVDNPHNDYATGGKVLTPAWLRATVAQVKIALSTVLKLRTHNGSGVRRALERLCIALLDECHSTLANCTSVLVESAMVLREDDDEDSSFGLGVPDIGEDRLLFFGTSLKDLATIYPELMDSINTALHNWITSMPRIMQSSDERVKQQAIRNILKGNQLVEELGVESSNLQEALSSALRDSIVALVLNSKTSKLMNEIEADQSLLDSVGSAPLSQELHVYRPVLLPQESQRDTRRDITLLVENLGSPAQQTRLAAQMLPFIYDSTGVDQISSFWLSFQLVRSAFSKMAGVDDLLDLSGAITDSTGLDAEPVFNELYDFSVSVLDAHSDAADQVDWRLEALALEVTAFAASRMGLSFRPELIDVLYPMATFLGASSPELRGHAITTLNSLAVSCGYDSVSELIIDNVDYMVNSVSLRLNQFDISPASTKVLTMMIRLTGPRLLPFLDDVVAGIFGALENYHGYTAFVESLFGALSEVVEQGVKSNQLLIGNGKPHQVIDHRKRPLESAGIDDILAYLEKRAKRRKESEEDGDVEEIIRGHPKEAWKSAKDELDAIDARDKGEEDEADDPPTNNDEVAIPKTPTYTLLTKIASLTQHYLTSPTPTLRKQLLDVLSKVSPALAADENAFLPLVNDVWPVIVARLHDPEPYVVIAACETLSALCESAGDFLSSRVKTEWWDGLGKWCLNTREAAAKTKTKSNNMRGALSEGLLVPIQSAATGSQPNPLQLELDLSRGVSTPLGNSSGLGRFASSAQTWKAVVSMLTAIVSFVRTEDDMFEQILALLADDGGGLLLRDEGVRRAFEAVNADAVWLALYERGLLGESTSLKAPVLEGCSFATVEGTKPLVGPSSTPADLTLAP